MPRYTVDFSNDFDILLSGLAKEKKVTKADIIRRAVASYAFLDEQTSQTSPTSQKKLSITDGDDNVIKDILLP